MSIKTISVMASVFLVSLFGILSILLIRTSDLLDYEARELEKASESIQIAKEISSRLLIHNRNAFLHQLSKSPTRLESRLSQRNKIANLLKRAEQLVNNDEETEIVNEVKSEISEYLQKRDQIEHMSKSAVEKYNLVSDYVDDAIRSIDKLISINIMQSKNLLSIIGDQNKKAQQIAIGLFVLGGLLLLFMTIVIFRTIVAPLTSIAHTISKYSAGETQKRLDTKGFRETQTIIANFNTMADLLEEKRQNQLRFIASIAHDIRNPLNSMSMASELLMRQEQKKSRELCEIIFRQIQNLDCLVGDLLDTTRIEAGYLVLDLSEQDVNMLVKESIELYRTSVTLHTFKRDLPEEALLTKCDRARLSQVFNNLLSNAVKYSPNGGSITVKTWRTSNEIKILFSDQGIGIAPEDLQNIFKPFHRTKVTNTTIPGIGLGLSASRRIIESHGGSLEVESFPDKGSTFIVSLPSERKVELLT